MRQGLTMVKKFLISQSFLGEMRTEAQVTNMKGSPPQAHRAVSSEELSGNPHPDSLNLLGSQIIRTCTQTPPIIHRFLLPYLLSPPLQKSSWKQRQFTEPGTANQGRVEAGGWKGSRGERGRRTGQGEILLLTYSIFKKSSVLSCLD